MRRTLQPSHRLMLAAGVMLAAVLVSVGLADRLRAATQVRASHVTLSIVGTSDLHGYFMPAGARGGLGVFAGYVNNLRAARRADGGAVLLLDAGDTFQGGVESDLSEGALVVDAYNALGYTALAVGNHEFDFGSADRPGARQDAHADPRGALKARAAQATFPFLSANLLDDRTGQRVQWPNVHPSTIVDAAGIKVGLIGVMTINALRSTLPLNVQGLRMAPLADAVGGEAARLRAAGAQVVLLAAHAGGGCDTFSNPADLSSCDPNAEIFDLARALPPSSVDAIVAGHTHAGLAHEVAGVAIVQSYWGGRSFGRIDLTVERETGRVVGARPFAPRDVCLAIDAGSGACAVVDAPGAVKAEYEGRPVVEDAGILAAMAPALARVKQLQDVPLGVIADTPIGRTGDAESPLGNLYADALREMGQADVALNNNSVGGLRADLPRGQVTFGQFYDTFPFDNRLVRVRMTGDALEQGIANALRRGRRGAFGISGLRLVVSCVADGPQVQLFRPDGQRIAPTDSLTVVAMDSMLAGQLFAPAIRPGSLHVPNDAPIVREVVEDWLRERGGHLRAEDFAAADNRRVQMTDPTAQCLGQ